MISRSAVLFGCILGAFTFVGCSGSPNIIQKTPEGSSEKPKVKIVFVTPASDGDPVGSPIAEGLDGQNEFTYNDALPGVLTIDLVARVEPSGIASTIKSECKFVVDAVGTGASMTWDTANPGGQPTVSGDYLMATVRFTGLPNDNDAFGMKGAAIYYDGLKCDDAVYEVFFLKDAKNNPSAALSIDAMVELEKCMPNWLYYWGRKSAAGDPYCEYMYPSHPSWTVYTVGEVFRPLVPKLYFTDLARLVNLPTGSKGIDCFAEIVLHEKLHRTHIYETLPVPTGAGLPDTDMDDLKDADEVTGDLDLDGVIDTEADTDGNGILDPEEDIGLDRKEWTGPEMRLVLPVRIIRYGAGDGLLTSETGTVGGPASGTSKYHANSWGGASSPSDGDDLCYEEENEWTVGSADGYDWAKPGKQHRDKY